METKLTLRLNDNVIESAKVYTKNQKTSLSKMIEAYLDHLTIEKDDEDKPSITPLVESLIDIIITRNLKDFKTSIIPVMTSKQFIGTLK